MPDEHCRQCGNVQTVCALCAKCRKEIQTGKCLDYHTQIKAKNSADIQIEYLSDLSKYSNLKSKMI